MSVNTILIAGKQQSGKSSLAKFLMANELGKVGQISGFDITEDGEIAISTEDGNVGVINWDSPDNEQYFSQYLYPYMRKFSFATKLKQVVSFLFNIDIALMYGTNDDKNTVTKVTVEGLRKLVPDFVPEDPTREFVTIRELLRIFGTEICRSLFDSIWIEHLKNDIAEYHAEYPQGIALVDDCRFINEVENLKNDNTVVIYLDRNPISASHASEKDLDNIDVDKFDLVVRNANMDIAAKNDKVLTFLSKKKIVVSSIYTNGVSSCKPEKDA